MAYTIGEVSSILNISREMIRYYEKQGAINASRNSENNYRYYASIEIFWLLEAMQFKSWGIPISEIATIRENRFIQNTKNYLEEEILLQEKKAEYTSVLIDRLKQVRGYSLLGKVNIGNFWVTEQPSVWRCNFVTGLGDQYDRILLSKEAGRFMLSEELLPFVDWSFTLCGPSVEWKFSIEEKYLTALGKTAPGTFTYIPSQLVLCTHMDIGEIGEFNPESFHILERYAKEHFYMVPEDASINGLLLGRGYEDGCFHRIVQLYLPVQQSETTTKP